MFATLDRRQKRGVPTIPDEVEVTYTDEDGEEITAMRTLTEHEVRLRCVRAGMPEHLSDVQMNAWRTGEKLRGPGVTRKPNKSNRKAA